MKIPFFEILLLLFILWPLIQRFLEKNKPKQGQPQNDDYYDEFEQPGSVSREGRPEPQNWQEAMQELEMIFSGQTPPTTVPAKPEPKAAPEPRPHSSNNTRLGSSSLDARASVRNEKLASRPTLVRGTIGKQESDEMIQELLESSNPIYKSLNVAPEIEDDKKKIQYSVFTDIRDAKRLREFYVMKEILDKPIARRRVRNFL